jgi:prolyl-tRNA editing enzyme YbaK/EbsC (Cys-tRNA(Pro) deacylase)
MSSNDVARYLQAAGIPFRPHSHAPVRNAEEAVAAGLPFDPHLLTKTLVFRLPQRWLLVWMRALDRLDYGRLARAAGENRRKIRFAAEDEVASTLGWQPGGAAPLPLIEGSALLVDEPVTLLRTAFFGGGQRDLTIEVAPAEFLARVPHATAALSAADP